jgi:hypothetical protein
VERPDVNYKLNQLREFGAQVNAATQCLESTINALLNLKITAAYATTMGGIGIPGRHNTGGRPGNRALDAAIVTLLKIYAGATGERAQSGIHVDRITGETTGRFIDFATIALSPVGAPTPVALRKRAERLLQFASRNSTPKRSRKKYLLGMCNQACALAFVPSANLTTRGYGMPNKDQQPNIDQELAARLMRLLDDQPAELPKLDRLISPKQFCELTG